MTDPLSHTYDLASPFTDWTCVDDKPVKFELKDKWECTEVFESIHHKCNHLDFHIMLMI